ncbi:MAG: FG-GAP repeat protein, partial [Proteobacteria bacterium]|nr:FG-GAP repeat protein [Pseudomonadota bacterium]
VPNLTTATGLTLARSTNTHTCEISGTPTTVSDATDYVITATNANGSDTATVNITINIDVTLPNLLAQTVRFVATEAGTHTLTIAGAGDLLADGDTPTPGCATTPDLPTGLELNRATDSSTCVISGTPTDVQAATPYAITATNAVGSGPAATVTIEILDGRAMFADPPLLVNTAAGEDLSRSYINTNPFGGPVTSCVAADGLPTGMTITHLTAPMGAMDFRGGCEIVINGEMVTDIFVPIADYDITVTNANGESILPLKIVLNPPTPRIIRDSFKNRVGADGRFGTHPVQNTGGAAASCTFIDGSETPSQFKGMTITISATGQQCLVSGTLISDDSSTEIAVRASNFSGFSDGSFLLIQPDPNLPDGILTFGTPDSPVYSDIPIETIVIPNHGGQKQLVCNFFILAGAGATTSSTGGLSVTARSDGSACLVSGTLAGPDTPRDFIVHASSIGTNADRATLRFNVTQMRTAFAEPTQQYAAILESTESGLDAASIALINEISNAGEDEVGATVGDRFGHATALSSDGLTLAIGTPGDDGSGTGVSTTIPTTISGSADSGAVYVYTRTSTTADWTPQAYIKTPVTSTSDLFGFALALGG